MKIAIIADSLDNQSAGIHTYTKQLIGALVSHDTENEYLIIREKVDTNLPLEQLGIPNIRLPIGFAPIRLFFIIPFILRFKKVDVVFETAHFGPFNLPKRIKRITMIHDLTPILFPQYHRFYSHLLQRIFLKRILRKADIILSNSQNTNKDLVKVYPFTKSKNQTILLGRDSGFQPVNARTYLDRHNISKPYFLCTGTIEPRKNLALLLDAYSQFRKKEEVDVLLLLVGKDGWKTTAFYEKLENHDFRDDIVLTGFVEKHELIELYSNALALVYPSLYEGFGLPILEANSCGTQVICSNNSSLPEVGGDAALYFDPTDVNDLHSKLHTAFEDYNNSAEQTRKFTDQADKFSWNRYVVEFENTIKQRLGKLENSDPVHPISRM